MEGAGGSVRPPRCPPGSRRRAGRGACGGWRPASPSARGTSRCVRPEGKKGSPVAAEARATARPAQTGRCVARRCRLRTTAGCGRGRARPPAMKMNCGPPNPIPRPPVVSLSPRRCDSCSRSDGAASLAAVACACSRGGDDTALVAAEGDSCEPRRRGETPSGSSSAASTASTTLTTPRDRRSAGGAGSCRGSARRWGRSWRRTGRTRRRSRAGPRASSTPGRSSAAASPPKPPACPPSVTTGTGTSLRVHPQRGRGRGPGGGGAG